ncbi:MAG: Hsp20/alpha crystallin family protein [Gammaproteobacteria bacterium]|jgi:HSP20 family protein|nr:Hsp20/alpha crystallin family protein [Gammaproteobacteria bacterium]
MAKAKDSKKEISPSEKSGKIQRVEPARALSPFEAMERRMEQMERMFEDFFPMPWKRGFGLPASWGKPLWGEEWMPKADLIERDDEVVVRAELPGVEKDDLDLTVTDTTVTLKGETKKEEKEEKGNYFRSETSRGSFTRTFALPCEVDGSKAKADFKNGVLELTLPKVEKAKRHSIKIS